MPGALLQRKCGFELELQVPLVTKRDDGFVDPGLEKNTPAWEKPSSPVKIVQDNASNASLLGWSATSIVELVTEARDEFAEAAFLEPLIEATKIADKIETSTKHFTELVSLHDILPGARPELLVGCPTMRTAFGAQPWGGVTSAANVQATYAVGLASVSEWMGAMAAQKRVLSWEPEMLGKTRTAAAGAANKLQVTDPAFRGLLHVLCLYLVGGNMSEARLDKNRVALLVRHSLAHLVKRGVLENDTVQALTETTGVYRTRVIDALMAATDRKPNDHLFIQDTGGPNVVVWLEEVLSGRADLQIERWKEMKRIEPEQVGPEGKQGIAPVFEERQVAKELPPSEWVKMGKSYRERLLAANATPQLAAAHSEEPREIPDVAEVISNATSTSSTNATSTSSTNARFLTQPSAAEGEMSAGISTSASSLVVASTNTSQRIRPAEGEMVGETLMTNGATRVRVFGNVYRLTGIDDRAKAYDLDWVSGTGKIKLAKLTFVSKVAKEKVEILD